MFKEIKLSNAHNPQEFKVSRQHPCFNSNAHNKYGRLHLPVSPACNIQCRFCNRTINKTENRPGVTGRVLGISEVSDAVEKALELCPEITVVGIAGPGDTLATDNAINAFKEVNKKHSHLIKCLSTNGLLLPEKAEKLREIGVKTITVTVNAVEPEILEKIVSYIIWNGVKITGITAAEILIGSQLEGIEKIAAWGAVVKVNTVLIPGVNDWHIPQVAKAVSEAGASLYNIIPLIPQFKFADLAEPGCDELYEARRQAKHYIEVFEHCQRCRADAVGIPGVIDFADEIYKDRLSPKEPFSHG